MSALMAEMYGKTTGCSKGRGGSMHLFAPEVGILGTVPIVAATIPIAVGSALASVMQGTGRVAVAFFGDVAVEEELAVGGSETEGGVIEAGAEQPADDEQRPLAPTVAAKVNGAKGERQKP